MFSPGDVGWALALPGPSATMHRGRVMPDISQPEDSLLSSVLGAAARGDPSAAADLLPLVYSHLHALAQARIRQEPAGMTLQATALVHEAYLRIAGDQESWNDKRHFFAAAALAMRRILVERARQRQRLRHGGGLGRVELDSDAM